MVQPLAHQASAGISHRLSDVFALHVDAVYNNTKGDYKTLDLNSPVGDGTRPDPTYGRIDQVRPDSEVRYKAIYAKLEKRYSQNYQYTLSYTFTDADDNAPMARYLDPFDFDINWGPSNGERRHAIVASGSVLLPWDINVGRYGRTARSCPGAPERAGISTATRSPRTWCQAPRRNSGSRELNLDAVNAYRARADLAPIDASTIDSSRINIMDLRVSKRFRFGGDRRFELIAQAFNLFNTENLQAQFGGGRRHQRNIEHVRPDHECAPAASGRAGGEAALVSRH